MGVVDFEECIDLSDQGVGDALIALQQLYQRKLEKAKTKKQETIVEVSEEPEGPTPAQPNATSPSVLLPQRPKEVRSKSDVTEIKTKEAARKPTSDRRNSSRFGGIFQSKNTDDQKTKAKSTGARQQHRPNSDFSASQKSNYHKLGRIANAKSNKQGLY